MTSCYISGKVCLEMNLKVQNIEIPRNQTKEAIKTQNPKDKTITRNKETQMTGQHEPL